MRIRAKVCWLPIAAALIAVDTAAAPIDFTTGISTGAILLHTVAAIPNQKVGTIETPIADYLTNKTYTAQIVPTGSTDKSESFAAVLGDRTLGFASALSDGRGALEVGVRNDRRFAGFYGAVSRYYTTIKNNTDEPLDFDFFFVVEPGELGVLGIRNGFSTAHARVDASIEYLLRTPSGPFGGTYDETTGTLFDYFVDIDFLDRQSHSDNADVILLVKNDFELRYESARLADSVALPTIPAFGELTVYYDMYAALSIIPFEVGGYALLGDPTDLIGGENIRLVRRSTGSDPSPIPEPTSALLFGIGLLIIGLARRAGAGETDGMPT